MRAAVCFPGYTESPDAGPGTTAAPRSRSDRLGGEPDPGAPGSRAEPLRARRLLTALVGALRLQALGAVAEAAAVAGRARAPRPGRERRRPRSRRRPRGRIQGRVAQPSVGRRAVPGRGDGDRGDP